MRAGRAQVSCVPACPLCLRRGSGMCSLGQGLPGHICPHVAVTGHTHALEPELLRASQCTAQLGPVALRGLVAHQGGVDCVWADEDTWRPRSHQASGVATVHKQGVVPISPRFSSMIPFQVEILQVDFCSMRSTIWLTAVSGKRNNQIIIQSWVFNSRKASGC